jgi:hypothetical protein
MTEAAGVSETSVNFYQTTRCYNSEGSHLLFKITVLRPDSALGTLSFPYAFSVVVFQDVSKITADRIHTPAINFPLFVWLPGLLLSPAADGIRARTGK